ncbi:hypothetical protein Barb4_03746 [Bacteroidales bacterium Barb4]|nr:hypothetical protein Barb4_03746 [Bacteroidales bacterium Barb4]
MNGFLRRDYPVISAVSFYCLHKQLFAAGSGCRCSCQPSLGIVGIVRSDGNGCVCRVIVLGGCSAAGGIGQGENRDILFILYFLYLDHPSEFIPGIDKYPSGRIGCAFNLSQIVIRVCGGLFIIHCLAPYMPPVVISV